MLIHVGPLAIRAKLQLFLASMLHDYIVFDEFGTFSLSFNSISLHLDM